MSPPSPAKAPPERIVLDGRYARLEPIDPRHATDLYRVAATGDGEQRFTYLLTVPPPNEAALIDEFAKLAASTDPLTFAVIDISTNSAEGRQSLMRIEPQHGCIEIGSIYWGEAIARTRVTTEAFYLHAAYVFEVLGNRRFEWKCNDRNEPSKAAARRFGFTSEGLFRQHQIIKGQNRDTAWFSILDSEWPRLRAEYERWLDPANFDADGRQRSKLRFS
jgi:RimJ/RimL family protein N-acetyltransferase